MNYLFWQIMVVYAVLSCAVGPYVGYHFMPSVSGLERGYLGGTALSLLLWFSVGKKMVFK